MTPEEFRDARKQLGLTQREMAERLQVTLRQVQRLEAGENHPDGCIDVATRLLLAVAGTEIGRRFGV